MRKTMLRVVVLTTCLITVFASVGRCETRLRGVMVSPKVTAADLQVLGRSWKANLVRWQLNWVDPALDNGTLDQYDAWLERALKHLDDLLPVCQREGLVVLIDLHSLPGGRGGGHESRVFKDPACQTRFLSVWNKIARRYSHNKTVWGYDLANEPVQGRVAAGLMDWPRLAAAAATVIRTVDREHVIVVEPQEWANPASLANFSPLPPSIGNVVYSVHMYLPSKFTHQRVGGNSDYVRYPGVVDRKMWDKRQLREALQPVLEFQKKYRVRVLVGEFGAARWAAAGSAYDYLRDLIEIFESYGWDWVYHAFREWDGWSAEHTENFADHRPASVPTNREQLLRLWFVKNRHD